MGDKSPSCLALPMTTPSAGTLMLSLMLVVVVRYGRGVWLLGLRGLEVASCCLSWAVAGRPEKWPSSPVPPAAWTVDVRPLRGLMG